MLSSRGGRPSALCIHSCQKKVRLADYLRQPHVEMRHHRRADLGRRRLKPCWIRVCGVLGWSAWRVAPEQVWGIWRKKRLCGEAAIELAAVQQAHRCPAAVVTEPRDGSAGRRALSRANNLQQTVGPREIPDCNAGQNRRHAPQARKRPNFSRKTHCSPVPSWMPVGKI